VSVFCGIFDFSFERFFDGMYFFEEPWHGVIFHLLDEFIDFVDGVCCEV